MFNKAKKRYAFISKFIKIYYGHWGGYWSMATYPEIFEIVFNKNMEIAIVSFRSSYNCGGYARYKKKEGRWILLDARSIWVE